MSENRSLLSKNALECRQYIGSLLQFPILKRAIPSILSPMRPPNEALTHAQYCCDAVTTMMRSCTGNWLVSGHASRRLITVAVPKKVSKNRAAASAACEGEKIQICLLFF